MELVWPVSQTLPATSMAVELPEAAGNSGAAKSRAARMGPDSIRVVHQHAMRHGLGKIPVTRAGRTTPSACPESTGWAVRRYGFCRWNLYETSASSLFAAKPKVLTG